MVSRSLLALVRCHSVEWRHRASRSSQTSRSGGRFRVPVQSSTELRLLQSMTFVGGRAHLQACGATPLLRFWLLQHCPTAESTCEAFPRRGPGLPLPVRSVPRVSHPPDGFLLGQSARPCFMPERSWSSIPFRASILVRSRDRLSAIRCPPAVHASGSRPPPAGWRRPPRRGVHAAPGCSRGRSGPFVGPTWRWEVARLQGLAPRNESGALLTGG